MRKSTLSALITAALLSTAAVGNANAFSLTSGNASVDGNELGLSSWSLNGVNHLAAQNWWFNASTNVGSTPYNYELADYDATPATTSGSAKDATVVYDFNDNINRPIDYLGLTVTVDYTLSGGAGNTSSLSENISIQNNTNGVAAFTLFQYTDFDLGGYQPYDSNANDVGNGTDSFNYGQNDTITQLFTNAVEQTNGTLTAVELATTVPFPTLTSVGQALSLEDALFDGTVTGTANGDSYTGDAAWIWAYTFNIAAGQNVSISKSLTLTAVPVPAAVWLFASGLLGLVGIARRRA